VRATLVFARRALGPRLALALRARKQHSALRAGDRAFSGGSFFSPECLSVSVVLVRLALSIVSFSGDFSRLASPIQQAVVLQVLVAPLVSR